MKYLIFGRIIINKFVILLSFLYSLFNNINNDNNNNNNNLFQTIVHMDEWLMPLASQYILMILYNVQA